VEPQDDYGYQSKPKVKLADSDFNYAMNNDGQFQSGRERCLLLHELLDARGNQLNIELGTYCLHTTKSSVRDAIESGAKFRIDSYSMNTFFLKESYPDRGWDQYLVTYMADFSRPGIYPFLTQKTKLRVAKYLQLQEQS